MDKFYSKCNYTNYKLNIFCDDTDNDSVITTQSYDYELDISEDDISSCDDNDNVKNNNLFLSETLDDLNELTDFQCEESYEDYYSDESFEDYYSDKDDKNDNKN